MLIESEILREWIEWKIKYLENLIIEYRESMKNKTRYIRGKIRGKLQICETRISQLNEVLNKIKQLEDNNVNSRDNTK